MIWETAILVGLLFGFGAWLVLQGSFVRILLGFVLLSNAANLFVLAMSGNPGRKDAPVLVHEAVVPVDPLPQALILTAIVIGFGVIAYLVLLLYRIFLDQRTTNARELFAEEPKDTDHGHP